MEPVPASISEPPREKNPRFPTAFVVALGIIEILVVAAVVVTFWFAAPSEAQLRAVHPGMSQQDVVSLLGEPRQRSAGVWHYPLRIGFGDYENFLTGDTFQVTFGKNQEVVAAFCGD
jgi:hypothetical protein